MLFILVGGMWLIGYIVIPFVNISQIASTVLAYIIAISNSLQGNFLNILDSFCFFLSKSWNFYKLKNEVCTFIIFLKFYRNNLFDYKLFFDIILSF